MNPEQPPPYPGPGPTAPGYPGQGFPRIWSNRTPEPTPHTQHTPRAPLAPTPALPAPTPAQDSPPTKATPSPLSPSLAGRMDRPLDPCTERPPKTQCTWWRRGGAMMGWGIPA
ncbi:hypothetical protein COCON_G00040030 [Conger conger]|uniref:Uncharacterized protein n=1 Tax=Conger conger TaxID=82655 RepID=A0A9Q1DTV8_CONCO|nr:hypothetical protein COCON_G00040030 [Conger conger]